VRKLFYGLLGFNLVLLLGSLGLIGFALISYQPWGAAAQEEAPKVAEEEEEVAEAAPEEVGRAWGFLAAALATAVGSLSAAWALSRVGAAALGSITERPELFGRSLVYVGLAEGIAIYGIIISIMILGRL